MWDTGGHSYDSHYFIDIRNSIYQVVIEDGVTSIGDNAFYMYFDNLQKVTIGNTVREIGESAFAHTKRLFSIDIPGNVQTIGRRAFYMSSLRTCTLHQGLKTIGARAFEYTKLTGISIPDDISTIGEAAFDGSNLSSVTIPKNIGIIMAKAFGRVNATIYSSEATIVAGAFGSGSTLTADRGSTAEEYAQDFGISLKYIQYPSKVSFNANGGSVSKKSKQVLSETTYGLFQSRPEKVTNL